MEKSSSIKFIPKTDGIAKKLFSIFLRLCLHASLIIDELSTKKTIFHCLSHTIKSKIDLWKYRVVAELRSSTLPICVKLYARSIEEKVKREREGKKWIWVNELNLLYNNQHNHGWSLKKARSWREKERWNDMLNDKETNRRKRHNFFSRFQQCFFYFVRHSSKPHKQCVMTIWIFFSGTKHDCHQCT